MDSERMSVLARALLMLLVASSCIGTNTVTCPGSEMVCRAGTVCHRLDDEPQCVRPDQFPPCEGVSDTMACDQNGDDVPEGTCYGGACFAWECGNGRVDADEACDDGGNRTGDGCSADCLSKEVCGNGIVDPVRLVNDTLVPTEQCDDMNLVGHDGCSSSCRPESTRWDELANAVPSPRGQVRMALDAARGRIVLFGGAVQGPPNLGTDVLPFGETWDWRGGWARVPDTLHPSDRLGHGLAFHADARHVVLFGGRGLSLHGDTWILDGDRWAQATSVGAAPPAREQHAMAYHPDLGVVVFGGNGLAGPRDDTWAWDGSSWRELAFATRPSARSHAAFAFDPVRKVLVLHGGSAGMAETWELGVAGWTRRATTGPPRREAMLAFDPVSLRTVMFGGFDSSGAPTATTWSWDGVVWGLLAAPGPTARAAAGGAIDPETGQLIMFGGYIPPPQGCLSCTSSTLGDTWQWAGTTWVELDRQIPPVVDAPAVALDLGRRRIVRVSGFDSAQLKLLDDTWEHNGRRWIVHRAGAPARKGAALAYDAQRGVSVLFGGNTVGGPVADTWIWNGLTWTQAPTQVKPIARNQHAMAYDIARGKVVLFGGIGGGSNGLLGDTWEWDGQSWTNMNPPTSPSARRSPALAYDPIQQRVLLFGGDGNGDTWTWDGQSWIELLPAVSPSPRTGASMAWDPARGRMVLFGGGASLGNGSPFSNETWEWNGTTWSFLATGITPSPRRDQHLVSSPTGAGVFMVSGQRADNAATEDRRLERGSMDPDQTCSAPSDDDADGLVGCADLDCWATCSAWCPPGAPCANAAPRCGDGICHFSESCGICADCVCAGRCGDTICQPSETAVSCPSDC